MLCPRCGADNYAASIFCASCSALLNQISEISPHRGRPGGFWRRFWAVWLDGLLVMLGAVMLAAVIGALFGLILAVSGKGAENVEEIGRHAGRIVFVVSHWLYFTLMESSSRQATFGKSALGVRVTDVQGKRISFARANARFFGKAVSAVLLFSGFIMAGFTARKQALHDMMAGTIVVRG